MASIGGKGSGKTAAGARALFYALANNARCEAIISAPTLDLVTAVCLPEFEKICGGIGKGKFLVDKNENKKRLTTCNGSIVWYKSADRPEGLDARNCSLYWLDEAQDTDRQAFKNLNSRLRVPAKYLLGILTATPAIGGWLRNEFDVDKQDRFFIRVSSRENIFNADGYVDNLLSSYSESEAKAFVDGEWQSQSNQVYPEFDPKLHVVDYEYDPSLPVIVGVDFGYVYPAVVYAQRRGNKIFCFDEDVADRFATEILGKRIASKRYPIQWIACDPQGANLSSSASESGMMNVLALQDSLLAEGVRAPIYYYSGPGSGPMRAVNTGLEKVRGLLKNARGETRLYFSRRLDNGNERGLLKSIPNYVFYPGTQQPKRGDKADQVDHVLDAMRYMMSWIDNKGASVIHRA